MIFKILKEAKQSAPNAASRNGVTDGFFDIVNPQGGGGTLHKFGQGCSFEDIFRLPKKITGFRFQTQKITAFLVPKTNVISVLQLRCVVSFQYENNQLSSQKISKRVSGNLFLGSNSVVSFLSNPKNNANFQLTKKNNAYF